MNTLLSSLSYLDTFVLLFFSYSKEKPKKITIEATDGKRFVSWSPLLSPVNYLSLYVNLPIYSLVADTISCANAKGEAISAKTLDSWNVHLSSTDCSRKMLLAVAVACDFAHMPSCA